MKKVITLILIVLLISFIVINNLIMCDSNLDYSNNSNLVRNPDRGFYEPYGVILNPDSDIPFFDTNYLEEFYANYDIMHLRIGLDEYANSSNLISKKNLTALSKSLNALNNSHLSVIIRFSYDRDGLSYDDNNKYLDPEPSLEIIKKHIVQLSKVLNDYIGCITTIETGMLGPWGEQHTSSLSKDPNSYYEIVETWLNGINKKRPVSVRRPLYYLYWFNKKYQQNITIGNIDIINDIYKTLNDDTYKKVGIYNDGYLASSSDLGTFSNREKEINFLNTLTKTTFYGGEITTDNNITYLNDYNKPTYLEKEAFLTHTSYLNNSWNNKLISIYKNTLYQGNNKLYHSKSFYDYLTNTLGYRLLITKFKYNTSLNNNYLKIKLKINNLGFSNIINKKNSYLVLLNMNDNKLYEYKLDMDITSILNTKEFKLNINISNLKEIYNNKQTFKIYLKIQDELDSTDNRNIRFINNNIYDENLKMNYITNLKISF